MYSNSNYKQASHITYYIMYYDYTHASQTYGLLHSVLIAKLQYINHNSVYDYIWDPIVPSMYCISTID